MTDKDELEWSVTPTYGLYLEIRGSDYSYAYMYVEDDEAREIYLALKAYFEAKEG